MKKNKLIKTSLTSGLIVIAVIGFFAGRPMFAGNSEDAAAIDSVVVQETFFPVLANKPANPVLRLKVYHDAQNNGALKQISLRLNDETSRKLIKTIEVFYTADSMEFSTDMHFGDAVVPSAKISISGNQELLPGCNYFWVAVTLYDNTDLDKTIKLDCDMVTDGRNKKIKTLMHSISGNRPAIAFHGDSSQYGHRIYLKNPGLITTNKGTLVAVYDMRHYKPVDSQADIDIGMSRSTDNGRTWETLKIVMDMGKTDGLPEDQNGLTDPAILLDEKTNTIWVAALWAHAHDKLRIWRSSKPGMFPDKTGQLVLVKSEDDGKTWSAPINITGQLKDPSWHLFFHGPGKGITMKNGTLVFAAQYKDAAEMPYSTIIYSKDRGNTWHIGTGAKSNTTESQVVELQSGELMLNMRDNRGGSRSVYTTNDMGKTWTMHPTTRSVLIEPVCQASIINFHYDYKGIKKELLLFSNPNTIEKDRRNFTLKVSEDDGMSWPEKYYTLLDAVIGSGYNTKERPRGYSCITQIDGHTAGIIYGSSRADLVFQRLDISTILNNR